MAALRFFAVCRDGDCDLLGATGFFAVSADRNDAAACTVGVTGFNEAGVGPTGECGIAGDRHRRGD